MLSDDGARRIFPTGALKDIGYIRPDDVAFALVGSERDLPQGTKPHVHLDHVETASTVMRKAERSPSTR